MKPKRRWPPRTAAAGQKSVKPNEREVESLGLTLSTVTPDIRRAFNIGKDAKGVVVTAVKDDGNAAEEHSSRRFGRRGKPGGRRYARASARADKGREKRGRKSVLHIVDRQAVRVTWR